MKSKVSKLPSAYAPNEVPEQHFLFFYNQIYVRYTSGADPGFLERGYI